MYIYVGPYCTKILVLLIKYIIGKYLTYVADFFHGNTHKMKIIERDETLNMHV